MPAEHSTGTSPAEALIERQLATYNRGDLEGFLACYSDDVVVASLGGGIETTGIAALRERYGALLATHPDNRARVVNRMLLGNRVVDHEMVDRGGGGERFEVIAIYTIIGDKIARVDFLKS
jgi:hypothetical protein